MKNYSVTTAAGSFDVEVLREKKDRPGTHPVADVRMSDPRTGIGVELTVWTRSDGARFATVPSRKFTGSDGKSRFYELASVPRAITNAVAEAYGPTAVDLTPAPGGDTVL